MRYQSTNLVDVASVFKVREGQLYIANWHGAWYIENWATGVQVFAVGVVGEFKDVK